MTDTNRAPAAPMTLTEFCAEADRIGLTAETLAQQLAARPEFADCLPPEQTPMFYASPEQANALRDRPEDSEGGVYLPLRKTSAGKFTMPLYAAIESESPAVAGLTRDAIQKKALEHGFEYWRASDAHGVEATRLQTVELLQDLLGVEVEIKDNGCTTCNGAGMIGGPSFYNPGEGGEPCPDCATPPATAPAPGLPATQEPKYTVNGTHIVNRATGEPIPHDEPVFIFRACDKWACSVIGDYAQMVGDPEHGKAIDARFIQFGEWADAHPERMKEPTTVCATCNEIRMTAVPEAPAVAASASDAQRLAFMAQPGALRMVEEEKGLYRVYQDLAEPECEQHRWCAMTLIWHASAGEAIDAAAIAQGVKQEGGE